MVALWKSVPSAQVLSCCIWAFAIGVLIVFSVINREVLNSHATHHRIQAVYNVQMASAAGFLLVLPTVLMRGFPWRSLTDWWSIAGATLGANSLIACPLAVPIVGAQGSLIVNRCGGLCCSLLLDWMDGTIGLADYGRLLAFVAMMLASLVDVSDATSHNASTSQTSGQAARLGWSQLLMVAYASVGGMCITIQAKCNGRITKDLGCWTFAIAINLAAFSLLALPFSLYFWMHLGVPPAYTMRDWPCVLFDGVYMVVYFGSLAILPRTIGYTATSMLIMFGTLSASSVIDAYGVGGRQVPFTETRLLALSVVMMCVSFFSVKSGQAVKAQEPDGRDSRPFVLEEAKAGYGAASGKAAP